MKERTSRKECSPWFPPQGTILSHEHPLSAGRGPEEVLELLQAFRKGGGALIVDVTPKGCPLQRDVELLRSLAEEAKVEVLFGTGYYKEPYLPLSIRKLSAEEIADEFIQEIEGGIEDTGVRPAVIGEVGTSFREITPLEKKVLLATAIAHRQSGLPIITHTTHGTMGLKQLEILEGAGVDLRKVIIGHCDLNPDLKYNLEIARRGAVLGFDTVGKERWVSAVFPEAIAQRPDEDRIQLILELCERGFGENIVLSLDMLYEERELNPRTHGKYGYGYIFIFLDRLQRAGLGLTECANLARNNLRRIIGRGGEDAGGGVDVRYLP